MDLSKLSNKDLLALKQGRLQDLSNEGLVSLKGTPAPSSMPFESDKQRMLAKAGPLVQKVAAQVDDQLSPERVGQLAAGVNLGPTAMKPIEDAIDWVGQKTGLSNIAGKLMNAATGSTRSTPQQGQELVDIGLVGTKGMLKSQVGRGIEKANTQLSGEVASIPEFIPSGNVAAQVGKHSQKFVSPSGIVRAADRPALNEVSRRSADISSRGNIPALDALAIKRAAQNEGYSGAGDALASLKGKLAQAEATGYGQEIEGAYAAANPQIPNRVQELNSQLHALLNANKGLNKGLQINDLGDLLKSILGGTVNTLTGRSLGKSIAAQGANIAGQVTKQAPENALIKFLGTKSNADDVLEQVYGPAGTVPVQPWHK